MDAFLDTFTTMRPSLLREAVAALVTALDSNCISRCLSTRTSLGTPAEISTLMCTLVRNWNCLQMRCSRCSSLNGCGSTVTTIGEPL